jgi:hypothetical protein
VDQRTARSRVDPAAAEEHYLGARGLLDHVDGLAHRVEVAAQELAALLLVRLVLVGVARPTLCATALTRLIVFGEPRLPGRRARVRGALANNRGDQVTGGGGAFFFFNARAGLCRSRRDAGGRSLCITRLCQRRRPRRSLAGCCVLTTLRGGGV